MTRLFEHSFHSAIYSVDRQIVIAFLRILVSAEESHLISSFLASAVTFAAYQEDMPAGYAIVGSGNLIETVAFESSSRW